jgi:hypothetical protein
MPSPSPALNTFSYQKYASIVPNEVHLKLHRIFTEGVYGWKRKAKIILRLDKAHKWVHEIEQELIDACEAPRGGRPMRSQGEITRASLIRFLRSRPDEALKALCDRHSVSYTSFMKGLHPDPDGLCEALADEMLNVDYQEKLEKLVE